MQPLASCRTPGKGARLLDSQANQLQARGSACKAIPVLKGSPANWIGGSRCEQLAGKREVAGSRAQHGKRNPRIPGGHPQSVLQKWCTGAEAEGEILLSTPTSSCSVTRSRPILCQPMACGLPGSSVCEIFQARTLEWVATFYSRGYSNPRFEPASPITPALAGGFFTTNTTWEAHPPLCWPLMYTRLNWLRVWFCSQYVWTLTLPVTSFMSLDQVTNCLWASISSMKKG